MKFITLAAMLWSIAGCGLMYTPMAARLNDQDQILADGMWRNMLTPVDKANRDDLLGALAWCHLFEAGVDRVDFRSEKMVDLRRVVMEVHFRREMPAADLFSVEIYDVDGKLMRAERYSRADVERLEAELRPVYIEDGKEPTQAQIEQQKIQEKRWRGLQAATQPAGWVPSTQTKPDGPPPLTHHP